MAKMNIKTGDNVLVITGKDKGKVSLVTATSPKSNKVIVDGVNIQTRHLRARKQGEKSEIVKEEGFIEASNVLVVCPHCGKATRIGRKEVDGKNVRVCKKCGEVLTTDKKASKAKVSKAKATSEKPSKKAPAKASTVKKSTAKASTVRAGSNGDK